MATIKSLNPSVLESITKILGDTSEGLTGSEISKYLHECSIDDPDPNMTKWKRLYAALSTKQIQDQCANNIIVFIQYVMNPARHYNNLDWFTNTRYKLNQVLSFEGLFLGENGNITSSKKATTISEAAARASRLKEKLVSRNVHPDVLKFCREELLVDNYFHAVFEATKSVAEKILLLSQTPFRH